MSSDRSRRQSVIKDAGKREDTSVDRYADEALRSLVRVLAREAARELFAKSNVTEEHDAPEGKP